MSCRFVLPVCQALLCRPFSHRLPAPAPRADCVALSAALSQGPSRGGGCCVHGEPSLACCVLGYVQHRPTLCRLPTLMHRLCRLLSLVACPQPIAPAGAPRLFGGGQAAARGVALIQLPGRTAGIAVPGRRGQGGSGGLLCLRFGTVSTQLAACRLCCRAPGLKITTAFGSTGASLATAQLTSARECRRTGGAGETAHVARVSCELPLLVVSAPLPLCHCWKPGSCKLTWLHRQMLCRASHCSILHAAEPRWSGIRHRSPTHCRQALRHSPPSRQQQQVSAGCPAWQASRPRWRCCWRASAWRLGHCSCDARSGGLSQRLLRQNMCLCDARTPFISSSLTHSCLACSRT